MREEMGNQEISYLLFALSSTLHVNPGDVSDDHEDLTAEREQIRHCRTRARVVWEARRSLTLRGHGASWDSALYCRAGTTRT